MWKTPALLCLLAFPAGAVPAAAHRLVIAFGSSPEIARQAAIFAADPVGVKDRDLLLVAAGREDIELRRRWKPQGFTVILVGKDGTEKLRSHQPFTLPQLFALIDQMPMRQAEMKR